MMRSFLAVALVGSAIGLGFLVGGIGLVASVGAAQDGSWALSAVLFVAAISGECIVIGAGIYAADRL